MWCGGSAPRSASRSHGAKCLTTNRPWEGTNMPAALISVMDKKERARYGKQMDELVKLLRKNNEQVSRMAALMEKLLKAMGAGAQ